MANECIVASAIVYLSSEIISESRLESCQTCNYLEFGQDDSRWTYLCGLDRDAALSQPLGSVLTQGARAIAFPNIYQHRVAPFQLSDRTKPGRRRILVFFLVDPTRRVMSTAQVPPQQREWVEEYARERMYFVLTAHSQLILPLAHMIEDHALDLTAHTITLEQAKTDREHLMKERSAFTDKLTSHNFTRPYSFCEH